MLEKLNKMFGDRYQQLFVHLNKNVIQTLPDTEGMMTIPVVNLGPGGATVVPVTSDAFTLNEPASVDVTTKQVRATNIIYRIKFSTAEAEVAADKPEYFNYLMDSVLNRALLGYNQAFGGPEVSRFGTFYCTAERSGPNSGEFFYKLQGGEDAVEIRLFGQWAGNEEVKSEQQGN